MSYKISKILAAVDFSKCSINSLNTAAFLAQKNQSELYIIHVHDNFFYFTGSKTSLINTVANHSSNILSALANDIYLKIGIKPIIIEDEGYVPQLILKKALEHRIDLM